MPIICLISETTIYEEAQEALSIHSSPIKILAEIFTKFYLRLHFWLELSAFCDLATHALC